MTTQATLQQELDQAFANWTKAVQQFDSTQYNTAPFEGSWTPGQIVQHLTLANGGFADMLYGPTADAKRAADQHVAVLKEMFLNFDSKMQAPDFVRPEMKDYEKAPHLAKTEQIKATLAKALADLDLNLACTSFELPVFGHLTRLEAATFVLVHTLRHTNQLNRAYQHLA